MQDQDRPPDATRIDATRIDATRIEAIWTEAAGVVQSDQDAEVRLEARGLMVAEMAEVELAERWLATPHGQEIRILVRSGTWVRGRIDFAARDHLVLDCPRPLVLPGHAICAVTSLSRVLHHEPAVGASWRTTLRDHLGTTIIVTVGAHTPHGRLIWVGRDHISIDHEDGELTLPWASVDSVAVTA